MSSSQQINATSAQVQATNEGTNIPVAATIPVISAPVLPLGLRTVPTASVISPFATPVPSAGPRVTFPPSMTQFMNDPANLQAIQGFGQVMAMCQQNGAFARLGEVREAEPARTRRSRSNRQEPARTRASRQEEEAQSQPRLPVANRLTIPNDRVQQMEAKLERLEKKVGEKNDRDKPLAGSPFTTRVHLTPFPRKVKIDAPRFTGKEDPEIHLDSFNQSATMNGCTDEEKCLLFFQTLRNRATEWFNKLRPGSIDSFSDLASKFKAKFQENCTKRKKFTYLSTAGQRESENLTQFLTRWKEEVDKVEEMDDKTVLSLLLNGLRAGELYKEFCRKPRATYQEAYHTAWEFAEAETQLRAKRKAEHGHKPKPKAQEKSHQWVRPIAPRDDRRRNNRPRKRQPAPEKEHIGMIFGGPEDGDSAAQWKNWVRSIYVGEVSAEPPRRKHTRREPIVFTDRDLPPTGEDHNDPLVITMDINGVDVARVLVDTGSSVNILYLETFQKLRWCRTQLEPLKTHLSGFTGDTAEAEGSIVLPVELGSGEKTVWKKMRFIVVDIKCVHNAILGRPGINRVGAVISMPHLCMKFHTPGDVGEVKGDQRNARECYARAVKKMTKGVNFISQEITKGETREKLEPEAETVEIELHISMASPRGSQSTDYAGPPRIRGHIRMERGGYARNRSLCYLPPVGHLPVNKPTEQWWEMAVDGTSGPRGYGGGIVFTTPEGFKIYHAIVFNFKLTNNEAEYEALAGGLRLAQALEISRVSIKSDSSLIVGQVTSNMEAREGRMAQYKDLVLALLKGFEEFMIAQIPRAENADADLLSKLTQYAPEHVSKLARVEILDRASVEKLEVTAITARSQFDRSNLVGADDHWMYDLMEYLMDGSLPEQDDRARKVKLRAPRFKVLDGKLYKRAFGGPLLRCLTNREAERVIAEVHEGVCAAHQMSRTLSQRIILLGYYWPTIVQDCERYVQKCRTCQVFYKYPGRPATYYHPVSNVIPFARFGVDIIGAFPIAQGGKKFVIVAIDYFTKWIEVEALANITTQQCKKFIWKNIITRFGAPMNLITDNGPQFRNPRFTEYLEGFGIKHNRSSVAYPQGNGQVENANRTIVDGLKKRLGEAGNKWLEELPHIVWAFRVTPRRAHGETPFSLTYGCEARLPIEAEFPMFRESNYPPQQNEEDPLAELNLVEERRMAAEVKMSTYQQVVKKYHDNKVGPQYFQVGDEVLRRREASRPGDGGKLAKNWEGPYRVRAIIRPGTYRLETLEGVPVERTWNSHHLRKFYT
ncbi:unnamed protein product [Cuscuta campestris]|uniref:Uncharacterized protein n=1 Tax=Cuscuta campestris TaxID=132261 RepID=A0A484L087_9ASTE|nr:unnamed protein product [Cuscuta campestris]